MLLRSVTADQTAAHPQNHRSCAPPEGSSPHKRQLRSAARNPRTKSHDHVEHRARLRPDLRPHLLQLLNYTLLAALILIAGALGTFTNLPLYAGIFLPQFDQISGHQATVAVQLAALALAALALVPARRVRPIPNLAVLSFSLFLAASRTRPPPPGAAVVIDLPLAGEWAMVAGGRSRLLSHHYAHPSGRDALDFVRLVNGQAFPGDPEHHASWHGYGQPVLAAADGTVVSVRDDLADQPIGVFGQGEGNAIVLGISGGRYVVLEHLQQGSALVRAGQSVTRGQRIAAVGNTGNSLRPTCTCRSRIAPRSPATIVRCAPFRSRSRTPRSLGAAANRRRSPPASAEATSSAPTPDPEP